MFRLKVLHPYSKVIKTIIYRIIESHLSYYTVSQTTSPQHRDIFNSSHRKGRLRDVYF